MTEDPLERFFILWTWKESLTKAVGLGMSLKPISFDVLPFTENLALCLNGQTWYAATDSIAGYRFSVCAPLPIDSLEWVEMRPDDLN